MYIIVKIPVNEPGNAYMRNATFLLNPRYFLEDKDLMPIAEKVITDRLEWILDCNYLQLDMDPNTIIKMIEGEKNE